MSAVCLLSLKLSMKHIISILFGFRSWTAIIFLLIILNPNIVLVMKLTKNCWQVWKYGLAWSFALWELLVWFVIFYHFLFSPGKKKSIISLELGDISSYFPYKSKFYMPIKPRVFTRFFLYHVEKMMMNTLRMFYLLNFLCD